MLSLKKTKNKGAILIIVLWFIVLITVIVATLAIETRVSAKIVSHNKMGVQTWNDTLQALHAAEMELLINKMPDPPSLSQEIPLSERKNKKYRFDGRILKLAYPIPETVNVRIYNHAGKINILRLSKKGRRELFEQRIGNQPEQLDALEDAWQDWIDKDDLKHANGAEKDYYESLTPPYEPRNAPIETVEEILLIKGFAEVFKGMDINNAFTVYGTKFTINPNLATREALMMLPGLDEKTITAILILRREKEFKSHEDLNVFIEPEQLAELRSWINYRYINKYYTIAIQIIRVASEKPIQYHIKADIKTANDSPENTDDADNKKVLKVIQHAYMVTISPKGSNKFPQILMVQPYGILPDTRHNLISINDIKSDL